VPLATMVTYCMHGRATIEGITTSVYEPGLLSISVEEHRLPL
jgi:hypothetical protein